MTPSTASWRFPAILLLFLAALMASRHVELGGDVVEYVTDTVALASHGTPDIRLDDIERARQRAPGLTEPLRQLEQGMRNGDQELYAAFVRGREGKVYSVHFFGYPALAALPYAVLERLHVNPLRAFQVVNYLAIFILGLALRRFFGCTNKAVLGLMLFALCGGTLYADWTSPECLSAACLLAALLLLLSGAPVAAGLLGGVASLQNPTIVFFFAFGPLLKLWLEYKREQGFAVNLKAQLTRANLGGLALGLAVFALPLLFNLVQWGVPNIIAKKFSDPHLVGLARLVSFFFDLNQGMVLGIPGVLAALALWGWKGRDASHGARRTAGILVLSLLFMLALTLPALAVLNWNSGAAGVMRYAFWAAMPILLALLLRMREQPSWPKALVLGLVLAQGAAMQHATMYSYVEMSPLARLVLRHAPQWYHPEPEIFAERMGHNDNYIRANQAYSFDTGTLRKSLYYPAEPASGAQLCGSGGIPAPDNRQTDSAYGWRYIDGPVRCVAAGGLAQRSFQAAQFRDRDGIRLAEGWSNVEFNGDVWNGSWSQGARSRLVLSLKPGERPAALTLLGQYLDGNRRTRVRIDGVDLGWQQLDRPTVLPLPKERSGTTLTIELEHEAPHSPGPGDPRALAFFLREVNLREAASLASR